VAMGGPKHAGSWWRRWGRHYYGHDVFIPVNDQLELFETAPGVRGDGDAGDRAHSLIPFFQRLENLFARTLGESGRGPRKVDATRISSMQLVYRPSSRAGGHEGAGG